MAGVYQRDDEQSGGSRRKDGRKPHELEQRAAQSFCCAARYYISWNETFDFPPLIAAIGSTFVEEAIDNLSDLGERMGAGTGESEQRAAEEAKQKRAVYEKVLEIRGEHVLWRLARRRAALSFRVAAAQGDAIGCRFGAARCHAAPGMVAG